MILLFHPRYHHTDIARRQTFQVLIKKEPFEILVLELMKVSDSNAWVVHSFAFKEVTKFFISVKLKILIYSSAGGPLKNNFQ